MDFRPTARSQFPRRKSAFTLVEMLVVVAIIGILAAILMPSLTAALGAARATYCANTLKQFGVGNGQYIIDYNGVCVPIRQGESGARAGWGGNAAFQIYVQMTGCNGDGWAEQYLCPEALYRNLPWYSPSTRTCLYGASYGMNYAGTTTASGSVVKMSHLKYTSETLAWKLNKIKSPGRRFILADAAQDCLSMEVGPESCGYYLNGEGIYPPLANYAPRHQGKGGANHLYVDGHAGYIPSGGSFNNTELWYLYQ